MDVKLNLSLIISFLFTDNEEQRAVQVKPEPTENEVEMFGGFDFNAFEQNLLRIPRANFNNAGAGTSGETIGGQDIRKGVYKFKAMKQEPEDD